MINPKKDPRDLSPVWSAKPFGLRLRECLLQLVVHGVITDADADRAIVRLNKWEDRWGLMQDDGKI